MPEIAIPTSHIADRSRPTRPQQLLRSILRDATAAEHARLDSQLGALDLCTLGGYRRFLEINAAALLPLEQSLVSAGVRDLLPDWDDRARSESIHADLSRLGGTTRLLDAPVLADRAALLGTLYVLEGSRLGAAYLLRAVRQCSDPVISGTTAFLAHGAGRPLWPGFLAILESHAGDIPDEVDIIAPARRAFALFEQAAALS
jgi:heme oxygenase (biliverdin-IX-beta and delta-forming)